MNLLSHHDITIIFVATATLLGFARLFGELAQRWGQPAVLGELLAGVVLGPTIFGSLMPELFATIFPSEGGPAIVMQGLTTLAIALFLLVAGMEIDLSSVWRQGRVALTVGTTGIVIPFGIGFASAWWLPQAMGAESGNDPLLFSLFMGTALSISALPVIAKTLMDLNLYRTDLGIVVVAAAVFNDLVGWIIFALILGMMGGDGDANSVGTTVALTFAFVFATLVLARRPLNRILTWVQAHASWPGGVLGLVLSLALAGAAFTEWIGIHAIFGAFLVGVALGDAEQLRTQTRTTIEQFISFIFAPLFFASIGLGVDFVAHFDPVLCMVVFAIATVGKLVGCKLGARLSHMTRRDGWALAFGMNSRGTMEIILGLLALQAGLIGERLFVALVVMAIGTSLLSGPLMQRILRRVRPLRLVDHVSEQSYVGTLGAYDRWGVIRELSRAAAADTGIDAERIAAAATARELLMPTGLGHRVAVPNARIAGLKAPLVALGLSRAGIDFDAHDGQSAQVVCLLLVPDDDDDAQWTLMADISERLSDRDLREQLLRAYDYTEVRALLRLAAEADAHDAPETPRDGLLLVGAGPLARLLARRIADLGSRAWLVDTNHRNIEAAQAMGLNVVNGNALRDVTLMQAHAFQAAGLVALTPNEDTNREAWEYANREFDVPRGWAVLASGEGAGHRTDDDAFAAIAIDGRGGLAAWDAAVAASRTQWRTVAVEHDTTLSELIAARSDGTTLLPLLCEREGTVLPLARDEALASGDIVHAVADAEPGANLRRNARRAFERAPVLDFDEPVDRAGLFAKVVDVLANRLHQPVEPLAVQFSSRERMQTGKLTDDLAVPHVALDGNGIFELVVCRVRHGVVLEPGTGPVHVLFVLAASPDMRGAHLHALATIAELAQRSEFSEMTRADNGSDSGELQSWIAAVIDTVRVGSRD
jgi:Kef-type K+ transport system membrane component KefB/mannitol/fructose-specific phosphotransferase system IIA component (Ntr-type)